MIPVNIWLKKLTYVSITSMSTMKLVKGWEISKDARKIYYNNVSKSINKLTGNEIYQPNDCFGLISKRLSFNCGYEARIFMHALSYSNKEMEEILRFIESLFPDDKIDNVGYRVSFHVKDTLYYSIYVKDAKGKEISNMITAPEVVKVFTPNYDKVRITCTQPTGELIGEAWLGIEVAENIYSLATSRVKEAGKEALEWGDMISSKDPNTKIHYGFLFSILFSQSESDFSKAIEKHLTGSKGTVVINYVVDHFMGDRLVEKHYIAEDLSFFKKPKDNNIDSRYRFVARKEDGSLIGDITITQEMREELHKIAYLNVVNNKTNYLTWNGTHISAVLENKVICAFLLLLMHDFRDTGFARKLSALLEDKGCSRFELSVERYDGNTLTEQVSTNTIRIHEYQTNLPVKEEEPQEFARTPARDKMEENHKSVEPPESLKQNVETTITIGIYNTNGTCAFSFNVDPMVRLSAIIALRTIGMDDESNNVVGLPDIDVRYSEGKFKISSWKLEEFCGTSEYETTFTGEAEHFLTIFMVMVSELEHSEDLKKILSSPDRDQLLLTYEYKILSVGSVVKAFRSLPI